MSSRAYTSSVIVLLIDYILCTSLSALGSPDAAALARFLPKACCLRKT